MRIKLITLRFSPTLGCFDETPLQDAVRGREVLTFREHFFEAEGLPHLTCVLTLQEPTVAAAPMTGADTEAVRAKPDATAGLTESDRRLFNTLRTWRAERARAEGLPPYVILTNRQLRDVVERKPESRTALGHVPGLGPKKIEAWGEAILRALHGAPAPESAATATEGSDAASSTVVEPDEVAS